MSNSAIATAADYADALLTARRALRVITLILVVMILGQLALFFVAKFTNVLFEPSPAGTTTELPTTLPAVEPTLPPIAASTAQPLKPATKWVDAVHYLVGATSFVGVTLTIVLSLVLLLLVNIMLVGRLIGVARVTSAYIWCLVLLVLVFPWQAFLMNHEFNSREFMVPGVLYTWDELLQTARFANAPIESAILRWGRFVAFPVAAVVLLLSIQVKSNRGLRQALGEDDLSNLISSKDPLLNR